MNASNQISGKKRPWGKVALFALVVVAGGLVGTWLVMRPVQSIAVLVQNATAVSADLTVANGSGREVEFGEEFVIERQDDGRWTALAVQPGQGFGLVGYSLLPGESRTLHLTWETLYGPLEPGNYRIAKRFTLPGRDTIRYGEFSLSD